MEFDPDSYFGTCAICGVAQTFVRKSRAIRETYHCVACRASLRERSQAQEIVTLYGQPGIRNFTDLAQDPGFRRLRIYEPGTSGPLRRFLRDLPGYEQSDYVPPSGTAKGGAKIRHEDLHALSFADESFDLVITSDIFEHVRRPMVAFAEIRRVLKTGGWHVFTVPVQAPIPACSVARVDTSGDTDVHLLPPYYHGDGKGGKSLVYTDFGQDLIASLEAIGLRTQLKFPTTPSAIANRAPTLISGRIEV
jgi:SAM-dependent methyltransferase